LRTAAAQQIYRHAGNAPDQLVRIHDGLGKDTAVSYKSIGDSTVYVPDTDCLYPFNCTNRALWVVSSYSVNADWDAQGKPAVPSLSRYHFNYSGGRSDVRGRGWLGFATQRMTNDQTGATTTTVYNNSDPDSGFGYPLAGLPRQVVVLSDATPPGAASSLTRTSTTLLQYDVATARATPLGSPLLALGTALARPSVTDTTVTETVSAGGSLQTSTLSHTTTTLKYDAFNNVTSRATTWSNGEQRTATASYDQNVANGKYLLSLLRRTDETSAVPGQPSVTRTHLYTPDPNTGLVTDETIEPAGDASLQLTIHHDRNAFGQETHVRASAADPLKPTTQIARELSTSYDAFDSVFPSTTYNSLGHGVRTVYDPGLGVLVFAMDPNGVRVHAQYDGLGRPRGRVVDGRGTTTIHYEPGNPYGAQGPANVIGLYSIETDQAGGGHSIATYNAIGDEVVRGIRNHDGTTSFVETGYSAIAGQVLSVSRPHVFQAAVGATTFQYDPLGRPTLQSLPDHSAVQITYSGLTTTALDANNFAHATTRDERGRVVRVDEDSTPGASPPTPTSVTTKYGYGPFGALAQVSVTPQGSSGDTVVSVMRYDDLGRRIELVDADTGHSSTSYNAFGDVVTGLDANGQTHIFARDSIGRVLTDFSTQDGSALFQWDSAPHGVGMLAGTVSADRVSTAYGYDVFGRPTDSTWTVDGQTFSLHTGLDDFGRVNEIDYPSAAGQQFAVRVQPDAIGATSNVTSLDPKTPMSWSASAWEADGQLTQEAFGQAGQTTRTYDPSRAWLTAIKTATPSETVQDLSYSYDPNGNLLARDDNRISTAEDGLGYDFLNRLRVWNFHSPKGDWNTKFDYDDHGNLQARTTTGPAGTRAVSYSYGSRDAGGTSGVAGLHAVTSVGPDAYGYDPAGNQTSGPGRSVAFTSFGLPTKVTVRGQATQFRYAANHARAVKRGPGQASTLYIGGLYEKRTDAAAKVTHVFFVPGATRLVAQVEWAADATSAIASRKTLYLHDDHLGSIESVTSDGGPTQHIKYDPFGLRIDPLTPTTIAQPSSDITDGFTDQQHDAELGLINMQGRVYDPRIGRFLSADPFVTDPLTSQGFNRYSYVLNNPFALVDPTGFDPTPHGKACDEPAAAGPPNTGSSCDDINVPPPPPVSSHCGSWFENKNCVTPKDATSPGTSDPQTGQTTSSQGGTETQPTVKPPPPPPPGADAARQREIGVEQAGRDRAHVLSFSDFVKSVNWWRVIDPSGISHSVWRSASTAMNPDVPPDLRIAHGILAAGAVLPLTDLEVGSLEAFQISAAEGLEATFISGPGGSLIRTGLSPAELLVSNGTLIGEAGASSSIRVIQGGATEAQMMFEQLAAGGTPYAGTYGGTAVSLPGNGFVGMRAVATATGARAVPAMTIDVNIPGIAIRELKFVP
jgi:RHS repeat-associated protein